MKSSVYRAGLHSLTLFLIGTLFGCAHIPMASVAFSPSASSTTFVDVSVFNGETMLRHQDVLIKGQHIEAMGDTGTLTLPPDTARVEGSQRTLMPGLIDAHVHLNLAGGPPWVIEKPDPARYGEAYLYAGVTSVVVATHGKDELELETSREPGMTEAPHLFLCGPGLTAPNGHPIPFLMEALPWPIDRMIARAQPTAATNAEAVAVVEEVATWEVPFFKLFYDAIPPGGSQLDKAVMTAAITAAKAKGMRAVVHVGKASDMLEAAEAGADLLMHIAWQSSLTDDQVRTLAASKIPVVTTLYTMVSVPLLMDGEIPLLEHGMVSQKMIEEFQKDLDCKKPGVLCGMLESMGEAQRIASSNFQKLAAAGVPYLVGTDSGVVGVFPGAGLHHELATLVALGRPPLEVLQAATSRTADFLDPTHSFGRIAPGQRADLLLVRGDPSVDITATQAVEAVYLDGRPLSRFQP